MRSSIRRILAGVAGSVIALAASTGHAAYITGQQYSFSGTAGSYTVSGSFTIGAETGPGTGIFNFSSFDADSGAPGTDVPSGIDASDTVTSDGIFSVAFTLADGYIPFGFLSVNAPDTVRLFGADTMEYVAAGVLVQERCNVDRTTGSIVCDETRINLALPADGTFSVRLTDSGNRVPEPGVLALVGFAASAGALVGRRRRRV
jgi:hypothetical protein